MKILETNYETAFDIFELNFLLITSQKIVFPVFFLATIILPNSHKSHNLRAKLITLSPFSYTSKCCHSFCLCVVNAPYTKRCSTENQFIFSFSTNVNGNIEWNDEKTVALFHDQTEFGTQSEIIFFGFCFCFVNLPETDSVISSLHLSNERMLFLCIIARQNEILFVYRGQLFFDSISSKL